MKIEKQVRKIESRQNVAVIRPRCYYNESQWIKSPIKTKNDVEINDKLLGLNHVFNNKHSITYRIFWSVFIMSNMCLCIFQISDRVSYYLKNPLRTAVVIEQQSQVEFPSFTLCPYPGQYPKLKEIQMKIADKLNKTDYCYVKIFDIIKYSNLHVNEIWKNASILETIVQSVLQEGKATIFHKSHTIIRKDTLNTLGHCHTFTTPVMLEIQYHNAMRFFFKVDYQSPCPSSIFIAMHPDEDIPNIFYDMNPHYYKHGTTQIYVITLQKFIRKSIVGRRCTNKFSSSNCRRDCYNKILQHGLKCRLPHMSYENISLCSNGDDAFDAFNYEMQFQTKFDVIINCTECTTKCEEMMYAMNLLLDDKKENGTKTSIGFVLENTLSVVVKEEFAYSLVSLFCEIGGNLGLFLGLCLVSIVEIFESAALKIVRGIKNKLRK